MVRCSPSDKSAQVPRVHQVGPPSTRVAAVAGLQEELRVARRECKTKLVFRHECAEQTTAQAEKIAMCPPNKLSAVCLAPSQGRFRDPMSSSDMAVETGLVLFVGVIQDTTAHETSPLHVSKKTDGPLAPNCKRPLLRGRARANRQSSTRSTSRERRRGDRRNAQPHLELIAQEPGQQLRHAKVLVLRPPGGTVVRCIKLWRCSRCKDTPHTGIHTHSEEVCRLRKCNHRLGLDVLWPVCTRAFLPLASFRNAVARCLVQHLPPTTPSAAKASLL